MIPKAIREQAGLVPGVALRVELDGTGVHIEAEAGSGLVPRGRFLAVPATGEPIDDEMVDRLRRDGQR